MLDTLKKTFGITSTAPTPPGPSTPAVNGANKALKRWQLEHGRTEARVKDLIAQLDAEEQAREVHIKSLGERASDGLDTTEAAQQVRQDDETIRTLKAGLVVARQKDETAQAELKQAQRQVAIEDESAACAVMLGLAQRWEEFFATGNQLSIDTARAGEGMRVAGGNEKYAYSLTEITAQASLFAGLALHPLTNRGHVPTAFMKYKNLTDCLTAVCSMRTKL